MKTLDSKPKDVSSIPGTHEGRRKESTHTSSLSLSLMYACMHTHMHKESRGRKDKYIKKNTETKHIYYMVILI